MKNFLVLVAVLFLFTGFRSPDGTGPDAVYVVGKSQEKFSRIFNEGLKTGYFYYQGLTKKLLPLFKGLPYGSGNVSCPAEKTLVNFNSFNCVTLVESYWAMSYTLFLHFSGKVPKSVSPFTVFVRCLNRIRYFGGENCGMDYRIHYFTQQMEELDRAGLVFNVGMANGVPYKKKINYITENEELYGDLASSRRQKSLERILTSTPKYYYPLSKRNLYFPMAQDGDIISFTSKTPGLDVSHCGVITVEDGKPKLTHASGLTERVVLAQDLERYIRSRTKINGFFVYRPVFLN